MINTHETKDSLVAVIASLVIISILLYAIYFAVLGLSKISESDRADRMANRNNKIEFCKNLKDRDALVNCFVILLEDAR